MAYDLELLIPFQYVIDFHYTLPDEIVEKYVNFSPDKYSLKYRELEKYIKANCIEDIKSKIDFPIYGRYFIPKDNHILNCYDLSVFDVDKIKEEKHANTPISQ